MPLTHSEHVHVYYGIGCLLLGLSALWAWHRPESPGRMLWPALLALLGLSLILPVETGERRYQVVGWWDTLVSVLPWSLSEWLDRLRQFHVVQHKLAGVSLVAAAVGEWIYLRRAGTSVRTRWGQVTPACALGTALVLGIHGGTHAHLPRVSETAHHWILGVMLILGAIPLSLYRAGRLRATAWRDAFAVLLVLTGLDWALFYRLR